MTGECHTSQHHPSQPVMGGRVAFISVERGPAAKAQQLTPTHP